MGRFVTSTAMTRTFLQRSPEKVRTPDPALQLNFSGLAGGGPVDEHALLESMREAHRVTAETDLVHGGIKPYGKVGSNHAVAEPLITGKSSRTVFIDNPFRVSNPERGVDTTVRGTGWEQFVRSAAHKASSANHAASNSKHRKHTASQRRQSTGSGVNPFARVPEVAACTQLTPNRPGQTSQSTPSARGRTTFG